MKRFLKGKKVISRILVLSMVVGLISVIPYGTGKAADENLLNTYGSYFGYTGTCINDREDVNNAASLEKIKMDYNSITLENEMKPDALLGGSGGGWWGGGGSATLISRDEALQKGYYLPDNYSDSQVPQINFDTVDKALKFCYENGIGMRGHTLVWHSQTPGWFFREDYNGNNAFVSQDVMNTRMEFYIKSVMYHVYNNQYGSCVYAWDVVNEHFHATDGSGWISIYKKDADDPNHTHAIYIKNAFKYAYEALEHFKLQYSVSLFYNDYSTYDVKDQIVELIKYVNADGRICSGVGMQSHIKSTYPTVEKYIDTMKAFAELGEVQITEMDIGHNGEEDQANYVYNLFKEILTLKKNGANITALVFWGFNDGRNWRFGENALLRDRNHTPKKSYEKALQAFAEVVGPASTETMPPVRVEPKDSPDGTTPEPDATAAPGTDDNSGNSNTPGNTNAGTNTNKAAATATPPATKTTTGKSTAKSDDFSVAAPKNIKAVRKKTLVKLTWGKVDGAYRYEIYRSLKKNTKYKKIATVKKTKYTDKTVKKDKKYFYRIKTVKKIDGSAFVSNASKAVKTK